jgi:hypothetical protein
MHVRASLTAVCEHSFIATAQVDGENASSIHLAVTCNGMDIDFERTINAFASIQLVL